MRNWNILLIVFISSLAVAKSKQVRLNDSLVGEISSIRSRSGDEL